MKYRKKPVIVEAYQTDKELNIETLEGTMHASVGDYIITGVRGEQYPCKPNIFEQTYEPADTPNASPSAQPERKKGSWIQTGMGPQCSNCGFKCQTTGTPQFCPSCGAEMR